MESDGLRNTSARHRPEFTTIPMRPPSRSRPHGRSLAVRLSGAGVWLFSPPSFHLPLHEGVEQAGPGLVLAVVAEVMADALREVQKHVPGVARDAAHGAGILRQEVQPVLQQRRHVQREDEPPQCDGDGALQRALALLGVQPELEGEAVEISELSSPRDSSSSMENREQIPGILSAWIALQPSTNSFLRHTMQC